jgi:Rrf2 family protein
VLKPTKKADYALMAMKHLADHAQQGSASAKDVADSFGIPPEALAKILQRLAKAGLLRPQQGTNGGYRLARAAHTMSAFEVIQGIDGPLFITSCVTVCGECGQTDRCNIREPLRKVNESIEAVLRRINFSHAGRAGSRRVERNKVRRVSNDRLSGEISDLHSNR